MKIKISKVDNIDKLGNTKEQFPNTWVSRYLDQLGDDAPYLLL